MKDAILELEPFEPSFFDEEDSVSVAHACNLLVYARAFVGKAPESLSTAKKSTGYCLEKFGAGNFITSTSFNTLSFAYQELFLLSESIEASKQALGHLLASPDPNPKYIVGCYNNLGELSITTGRVSQAKYYFNQALNTIDESPEMMPFAATIYGNLSEMYQNEGSLEKARFYIELNRKGCDMQVMPQYLCEINYLIGLANLDMEDGDFGSALNQYKEALAICNTNIVVEDLRTSAQGGVLAALLELEDYRSAKEIAIELVNYLNQNNLANPRTKLRKLVYQAFLYDSDKELSSSFLKSSDLSITEFEKNEINILDWKLFLLQQYTTAQNWKEAERIYVSLRKSYSSELPSLEMFSNKLNLLYWNVIAGYYASQARHTQETKDFERVAKWVLQGKSLLESQRLNALGDRDFRRVSKDVHEGVLAGIESCYHLYKSTGDFEWFDGAWRLAQLNTSRSLSSKVIQAKPKNVDSLLTKHRYLGEQLHALQASIAAAPKEKGNALQPRYNSLNKERNTLWASIINKAGGLNSFVADSISCQDVQMQLLQEEILLQWVDIDDYFLLFTITKDQAQLTHMPNKWKEDAEVLSVLCSNPSSEFSEIETLGASLATALSPLLQKKSKVLIVSDGSLGSLPLEVLQTNGRMWVHSMQFQHLPSAHWLKEKPNVGVFSYAGWSTPKNADFSMEKLQANTELVERWNSKKQRTHWEVDTTIAQVLHLASHSSYDPEKPLESFVSLPDQNEMQKPWHAKEVYSRKSTPAALVILGGCNTAKGVFESGEGVLSLSRAFIYAGAHGTLSGRWELPDYSTAQIVDDFLVDLKSGIYSTQALTSAKRNYLNHEHLPERLKHPYYWSGLLLSGGDVQFDSPQRSFLWLLSIPLLLILLVVLKKRGG